MPYFIANQLSHKQVDQKDLLGTWVFEKFDFDSQSLIPESDREKYNERNKGTTLTFYKDNKFVSELSVNGEPKSIRAKYTLLNDNTTLIIQSDTMEIIELDDTVLRLHRKRVLMLFLRGNKKIVVLISQEKPMH